MEALRIEQIRDMLSELPIRLHYAERIDSTNEWAKREAIAAEAGELHVYLADTQTGGKGSRGRSWESPLGTSISMSILLTPKVPLDRLSMITLVMGLAAAEGMHAVTDLSVQIKWPNDVVYDGRKLCGILTELVGGGSQVVIGIGINVNMETFPEELLDKAISLRMATGHCCEREAVTAEVLRAFFRAYEQFEQTGDLTRLCESYNGLLVNRDREVRVLDQTKPFQGIARGINARGELLVDRSDTGAVEHIFAGEVSVRGIYGYV